MKKTNHMREYFIKRLKQFEEITYKRRVGNQTITHNVTGKIIKVRKSSVKLLIGNEQTVDVGFRNILYFGND